MDKRFFPLSAITKRINELLQPAISRQFWVKAEVASGRERAGSFFCDLIETGTNGKISAKLSCTIWPQELTSIRKNFKASNMDLVLSDGTVVGFLCSLRYSPQYGLSLTVLDADPSIAMGEMELKKREIIERLQKEGLFEPNKVCFVPLLPLNIGFITSAGSAAYNDFIQTLTASGFGFKIHLADAMMQGEQTEKSVIKALDKLSFLNVELIVIARGGGSKTDLYYLDNEAIARKIAACPIPVWTGIGHEIDTSVLDYVANKSFKTPTAVAEELTARFVQMRRQLDEATNTLKTVWGYRLRMNQDYLNRAITGIQQGARKLLEVTSSNLREQAQELRIRVKNRITIEKMGIPAKPTDVPW
jgi:exodeoxyribonuclease VII large subunit